MQKNSQRQQPSLKLLSTFSPWGASITCSALLKQARTMQLCCHYFASVWLQRNKYTALVEEVRMAGGEAIIFSAMHVSGEQLNQLTGISAILRFPLPDIEDQELDAEL